MALAPCCWRRSRCQRKRTRTSGMACIAGRDGGAGAINCRGRSLPRWYTRCVHTVLANHNNLVGQYVGYMAPKIGDRLMLKTLVNLQKEISSCLCYLKNYASESCSPDIPHVTVSRFDGVPLRKCSAVTFFNAMAPLFGINRRLILRQCSLKCHPHSAQLLCKRAITHRAVHAPSA